MISSTGNPLFGLEARAAPRRATTTRATITWSPRRISTVVPCGIGRAGVDHQPRDEMLRMHASLHEAPCRSRAGITTRRRSSRGFSMFDDVSGRIAPLLRRASVSDL